MTTQKQLRDLQDALNQWIGFDHILTNPISAKPTFPPYDIIRKEDDYSIIIALAGYKADDITITHKEHSLLVESNKLDSTSVADVEYVHKGIAKRSFKLSFNLSSEVIVDGSTLSDGILTIKLHKVVPETNQPKTIPIISC